MLTTSAAFKTAIASEDREIRAYLKFNGSTILRGVDGLVSIEWDQSVYDEDRLCIGCAVSSFITAEFFDTLTGVDFKNSYVEAFVGVVLEDTGTAPSGSIEPDTATVEYVSLGRFDITDSVTKNGKTVITAYDKLSKLSGEYTPSISAGTNGYAIADIVNDVLTQSGVGGSVSGDYGYVQKIQASTYREQLKYCLTMMVQNGSSYILDRTNDTLKMTSVIGQDATQLTITDSTTYIDGMDEQPSFTISSLQATTGTDVYTFGSGQGIEISNPYITNAQANAIYNSMEGFSYLPIRLEFRGNPAIDPGDVLTLTAGGKNTKIVAMRIRSTFNGGFKSTIDCYGNTETYYAMSESPTGTRITQAENMIRLEAARATAAEGSLFSLIDINAEGISLVSQKLNNIGGRNLLLKTNQGTTGFWKVASRKDVVIEATTASVGGVSVNACKATYIYGDGGWAVLYFSDGRIQRILSGQTGFYTFSCDAYYDGTTDVDFTFRVASSNSANVQFPPTNFRLSPGWNHLTYTAQATGVAANDSSQGLYWQLEYLEPSKSVTIANMMFEEGQVATAYSPAPEEKVGNNEIISKINVSPENITISANKVDLQGYVTFTNLSTSGQTAINGGNITTNTISADKLDITDLNAIGATIGGFKIETNSIHTNGVAITSNATNSVGLSSSTFTRTINGTSRGNLKFAIGSNFGVANDGTLYASNGNFTGTITSNNATITGGTIDITTSSKEEDKINLSFTQFGEEYHANISPQQLQVWRASVDSPYDMVSANIDADSITLSYNRNDSPTPAIPVLYTGILASLGEFFVTENSNAVRMSLSYSGGLEFRDSSGNLTASYPADGLFLQDIESKNLIHNTAPTQTKNGLTFTMYANGTVWVSGTATADTYVTLDSAIVPSASGSYILSGCPSGGASSTYRLYIENTSASVQGTDYGSAATMTLTGGTTYRAIILVRSGTTMGKSYAPMLRKASVADSTYVPYAPPVSSLPGKLDWVELFYQANIPTTATTYNCNWQDYSALIFTIGPYGNVYSSVMVPYTYFAGTGPGKRVMINSALTGSNYWEVYKNAAGSIVARAASAASTLTLAIYGIRILPDT